MRREETAFWSGRVRCAAWLFRPQPGDGDGGGDVPCVVLAHGFGGVREARLWAFAERFAQAGIAALVFDYRHFGASGGEPRQLLDIGRQQADWRAAIAHARALEGIDPARVAAWGSSFSAGHVAVIAAEDRELACAISQNPFLDGVSVLLAMSPGKLVQLTRDGLRDQLRALAGLPPYRIPIVGPPGSTAVMDGPDAEPGYRALFEPGDEMVNEVAARIALRVGMYRPGVKARRITCPWLVYVGDRDDVTPPRASLRVAARAPHAEIRHYDGGHFDLYVGELFEEVVAEQVDFLQRHLLGAARRQRAVAAA